MVYTLWMTQVTAVSWDKTNFYFSLPFPLVQLENYIKTQLC